MNHVTTHMHDTRTTKHALIIAGAKVIRYMWYLKQDLFLQHIIKSRLAIIFTRMTPKTCTKMTSQNVY